MTVSNLLMRIVFHDQIFLQFIAVSIFAFDHSPPVEPFQGFGHHRVPGPSPDNATRGTIKATTMHQSHILQAGVADNMPIFTIIYRFLEDVSGEILANWTLHRFQHSFLLINVILVSLIVVVSLVVLHYINLGLWSSSHVDVTCASCSVILIKFFGE